MGLDTTHGCWQGPYSSFNYFRRLLGRQIGIELDTFQGFGGIRPWATLTHDIKPLLNHSDCDGKLTVPQCRKIAKGLDKVLNNLNPDLIKPEEVEYFKTKIIQFRDGCLDAVSKNEQVGFH